MVDSNTVRNIQRLLTEELEEKFDGHVYYGFTQDNRFVLELYPLSDYNIDDIVEHIDEQTFDYNSQTYTMTTDKENEQKTKFQFIVEVDADN